MRSREGFNIFLVFYFTSVRLQYYLYYNNNDCKKKKFNSMVVLDSIGNNPKDQYVSIPVKILWLKMYAAKYR